MTPVVFKPCGTPHGRVLTFALVPFAGMWVYIGLCMGTCGLSDASHGMLLFAAVVFGLGFAAWNWRPFRAWIVIAPEGMTVKSEGMYVVPERMLSWDRIAAFSHLPGQPKSTSFFRLELHPADGQTKGKRIDVPMQGLGTTPQKILDSAKPFMARAGCRVDGPLQMTLYAPVSVSVVPIGDSDMS